MPFRSILIKDRRKAWAVVNVNHKRRSVGRRDGTPQTQKSDRRKRSAETFKPDRGTGARCEGDGGRRAILRRYIKPGISVQAALNSFSKVLLPTISKPVWLMI